MASVTDGAIGIDLNTVGSTRAYGLGETHAGNEGSTWLYVVAGSALTLGALTKIQDGFVASAQVAAQASADCRLGFAQTAFAASQYGFIALSGHNLLVRHAVHVGSPGQPMYTSDTAGAMSTATVTASQLQVMGVWITGTNSATTLGTVTAAVSFPHLRRPKAASD